MKTKILLVCIAIMFTASLAFAENGQYYFKFSVDSRKELDNLTQIISIDNVKGQTVFAYANEREFADFQRLGIPYEILPDPGSLIVPAMAPDLERLIADWDVYPTYQQYLDMMNAFAATYPDLCTIVNIGASVQGRQLLYARISDNVNTEEDEPEVQYSSTMHGDETTGYVLMLRLIDYLLSNYGADPQVTNMVNNMEIWINPLANPDGTYHGGNNTVNGAIRYNANNVDLNRNFPDPAAGQHPDGNAWQPETNAFMSFFGAHSFVISANFHGGIEVVNYPWDTWVRRHADDAWFINISRVYAESCQVYSNQNGYMTDLNDGITNGYDWYRVAGGRQDYMTYFKGGRETTIELSGIKLLPAGQLPSRWNYNRVAFLNYLENALYGVRGLVTDATNGAPLAATINVFSHDVDSARVFTDPQVGDYHRMLAAGTYTLQFVCPGYVSQAVTGVTVTNHNITTLDIQLQPVSSDPDLEFASTDAGPVDIGTMTEFHITLANNGGGSAINTVGVLSTDDQFVIFAQNSSTYPTIPPIGGSGVSQSLYRFGVSALCPPYHQLNFRLDLTADGGYIDSAFFSMIAGVDIEDFESGDFLAYPWQMGGNANWAISPTSPYEGIYCAKSGTITHNQNSQLSLQMAVMNPGELRFRYKVSSEEDYDFLKFYIDNIVQAQWSGEVPWSEAVYNITAGSHTFKWEYSKDNTVSNGSDCGYIDFIILPETSQPLQILTDSVPDWTINRPYSLQFEAGGGFGERTWDDRYGNLTGTGLTLSSDGLLSGTPSSARQITFTARVQDAFGGSAQTQYTFIINPALQITTESLPTGTVDIQYIAQLVATGGTGARTWIDVNNNLDSTGLSLSTNGLINGTPLAPAEIDFTARVNDITGDTEDRALHISIEDRGTYLPGDANNSGQTNGIDVAYLINYFKGGDAPPLILDCPPHGPMYVSCDVNGNCVANGIDITYLVNFFKGGPALRPCPDCPPGAIIILQDNKLGDSGKTIEENR